MYEINMHAHIHLQWCFSWLTCPCFYLWFIPFPFARISRSLYLLGDPSSCARGANIHPLLSLVSYQLFPPCYLTRPKVTPQIKLHIYIDVITTSAAPSDTIPTPRYCGRDTHITDRRLFCSVFRQVNFLKPAMGPSILLQPLIWPSVGGGILLITTIFAVRSCNILAFCASFHEIIMFKAIEIMKTWARMR